MDAARDRLLVIAAATTTRNPTERSNGKNGA
jgi:hypothetical protein